MPEEGTTPFEFDSDKLILQRDRTVPGDIKAIGPVVDDIMKIVSEMGCAKGNEFEIGLVIREALANAITHGCCEDPEKSEQISVSCDESRGMIIAVRDPGPGFDPKEIPSPLIGEQLYSSHGRGIYLINQLMDEVHFDQGSSQLWMRKH